MRYNELGQELPDDTPVEWPLRLKRPETMQEMMQRLIRGHISTVAAREGYETEAEANDFDVGDEEEPLTGPELMGQDLDLPDASAEELDNPRQGGSPSAVPAAGAVVPADGGSVDSSVHNSVDGKPPSSPSPSASIGAPPSSSSPGRGGA